MSPAVRHRVRPRIRYGACLLPPLSEGKVKEFFCVINAFNLSFNEYSWSSSSLFLFRSTREPSSGPTPTTPFPSKSLPYPIQIQVTKILMRKSSIYYVDPCILFWLSVSHSQPLAHSNLSLCSLHFISVPLYLIGTSGRVCWGQRRR